jgi:hypothetical protein
MTFGGRATHRVAMKLFCRFIAIPNDTIDIVNTATPAVSVNPIATKVAIVVVPRLLFLKLFCCW